MADERVPVLWICGPAGVGKTTVAWQIFAELGQSGLRTGYVDIDQLGMCYPERQDDSGRYELKSRNLGAVVSNLRAAGASAVVVSGVADPVDGAHADLISAGAVTVCRLRAEPEELRLRYLGRSAGRAQDEQQIDAAMVAALAEARALDASTFADVCVETTGVSAADVTLRVRASCSGWAGFSRAGPGREAWSIPPGSSSDLGFSDGDAAQGADGRALLVAGPTGVGKSTIGFELYLRTIRAGHRCAFIDLDQIGFLRPPADGDHRSHRVKARNLAAIWQHCREAGATHLVAGGPVDDQVSADRYAAALSATTTTLCRLHAGRRELISRILSRGAGGSWPQPGDPLAGQPIGKLYDVADEAANSAEALEHQLPSAIRIDTDGRSVGEAADLVSAATGWPDGVIP